jgi:hypothetical protein
VVFLFAGENPMPVKIMKYLVTLGASVRVSHSLSLTRTHAAAAISVQSTVALGSELPPTPSRFLGRRRPLPSMLGRCPQPAPSPTLGPPPRSQPPTPGLPPRPTLPGRRPTPAPPLSGRRSTRALGNF